MAASATRGGSANSGRGGRQRLSTPSPSSCTPARAGRSRRAPAAVDDAGRTRARGRWSCCAVCAIRASVEGAQLCGCGDSHSSASRCARRSDRIVNDDLRRPSPRTDREKLRKNPAFLRSNHADHHRPHHPAHAVDLRARVRQQHEHHRRDRGPGHLHSHGPRGNRARPRAARDGAEGRVRRRDQPGGARRRRSGRPRRVGPAEAQARRSRGALRAGALPALPGRGARRQGGTARSGQPERGAPPARDA